MYAPNNTKKGNKVFSYPFCKHLAITISAMVWGRLGTTSEWKFSFIKHELHVNG